MENLTLLEMGVVAVIVLVVMGGTWALLLLINERQNYKYEREIEAAVRLFALHAILAAYKLGDQLSEETKARVEGVDRKKFADSLYAMIPDKIGGFSVVIVKKLVTRERFSEIVQDVYDEFMRDYLSWEDWLDRRFHEWYDGLATER